MGSIDLVVTGYDGSDEAAVAVRWAAKVAQQSASALRVVWAWRMRDVWDEALAARHNVEIPPITELEDFARRYLTQTVDRLVAGTVRDIDIHLDRGPDAAHILLRAAADADMLVVGSGGRGRVATALVGSVSARCIREATCPVLVIPHQMVSALPDRVDPYAAQAEIITRGAGAGA
ncbi:MAG: universal stress protein [Pseudonocardiaceae bacterium]